MRSRRMLALVLLVALAAAMTPTASHAAIGLGTDGDGPTLIERIGQLWTQAETAWAGWVAQLTEKGGAGLTGGG